MAEREEGTAFDETDFGELGSRPGDLLAVGTRFAGRYRIDALLGIGGMGAVYRVRDERLDEDVALKVMTFADDAAARRFIDEVRLARRVTHPNVARTHDIGEHEGRHYLTMEYVKGETLEARLEREGTMAPRIAAAMIAQIAAGLEAAHASGVIHLDLKPGNVLLAEDGRAAITDFGIARARGGDVRQTGVVGTPAYMSPEQACGEPVDARSDLYALGTMLYELLSGRLPFEGDDAMAVALARLRRAPSDLRDHVEVPPSLAELVMALLAREPERRPSSAAEVAAALGAFGAGVAISQRLRPAAADHALAVLPFRYRGPPGHDYLGEGVAEELIDALSRTRGLKVLAPGTVARFADHRDPIHVGAELGVDSLVEGQVKLVGEQVRLSVRMHDTRRGVQVWSDRIDIAVKDVLLAEESLARRIAEALRLELSARPVGRDIPGEAVERYLRARRLLRSGSVVDADEAVVQLERAAEVAPDFEPALAAHAIAAVRAYWLDSTDDAGARRVRAERSVARAETEAPSLAETHVASALYATQTGRYREGAMAFGRALEIAPTMAEAHQHLGAIEVEAHRFQQGVARLQLSLELDTSLNMSRLVLVRVLDYLGQTETTARLMRELRESLGDHHMGVLVIRARRAMSYRDDDEIAQVVEASAEAKSFMGSSLPQFMSVLNGKISPDEAEGLVASVGKRMANKRFVTGVHQFATEAFAHIGCREHALRTLGRLEDSILVDAEWLARCPMLEPLRDHPTFAAVLEKTRSRAAAIWAHWPQ